MTPQAFVPKGGVLTVHTATAPPWDVDVTGVDFRLFTPELLHRIAPGEVRCWLFCAEYDVLDIARILRQAGFGGRLRVRSLPMPRPGMIRREILRDYPGLRITLDMVRPAAGAHHPYEAGIADPDALSDPLHDPLANPLALPEPHARRA